MGAALGFGLDTTTQSFYVAGDVIGKWNFLGCVEEEKCLNKSSLFC